MCKLVKSPVIACYYIALPKTKPYPFPKKCLADKPQKLVRLSDIPTSYHASLAKRERVSFIEPFFYNLRVYCYVAIVVGGKTTNLTAALPIHITQWIDAD